MPVHVERGAHLSSIAGSPPELHDIPAGCVYQSRCPLVQDICRSERPRLLPVHGNAGDLLDAPAAGPDTYKDTDPDADALADPGTLSPRPGRVAACHFSKEINNV